ncbi:MAG: PAS domain S-box protein [Bdellovibrionales bacterium]|nr:PAS domain S-box protein [Bdellovibrionales bacterium]
MSKNPPIELLEAFFEHSLDLLRIANEQGYFEYLNPSWSELLGYSMEELTSRPYVDFVHPVDLSLSEEEAGARAKWVSESVNVDSLNRYVKKDGSYVWLAWKTHIFGKFLLASVKDVTELL